MKITSGPPGFSSLFVTHQNRVNHTFWPHLQKNKQKMRTGWTTHSWNNAIWLTVRPCHMTMTRKRDKLEKPGGSLAVFMPYLADLLPFTVIFKRMLWRQNRPPAYHHHGKSIVFVEFVNMYLNLTAKPHFPYLWLLYFSHSTLKIMIIFYR